MKVVKPTSPALVSSSATELYSTWSSATAYTLNAFAIFSGRIYQCIQGPSTNNSPATSPLYWTDKGPSNVQAMFDEKISTQTSAPTSLTVVIDTGYINSFALFGLVGLTAQITATNGPAGPVVYSATVNLDGTIISDWYQYFFEPFVQMGELVLTDIPPYQAMRLTVTITGATASIGQLVSGTAYFLGDTELGATAGIFSFSKKDTSPAGITTFSKGANSKRVGAHLMLDNVQLNKVQRVLADLDGVPCVWIGSDNAIYTPLLVYGFFRDFSLDIAYATKSYCTLEIEGLT